MAAFDAAGRGSRLGFVLLVAALAAGCGGDDGAPGADGRDAVIGERSVAPEKLKAQITNVEISSPPVIEFQVTDERGLPVAGIDAGVSFTVNKLVPGTDGESDQWQSYVLGDDEGTTNAQATTYGGGTLEDNGDGTYAFTFDQDLADIDGVSFDADLTHRVGLEMRDVVVLGEELNGSSNGVYDFQPSSGDTEGITNRRIVSNGNCSTCHGDDPVFTFHGGPRNDVEYCVTCHQPDSVDAGTGNTIDFDVMIHKLHAGVPASEGNTYCGFGCENFGAPEDDFSDVSHPQDVRNCTTCHNPDNPETPEASNFLNAPTAETCASCHFDLAFDENGLTNANNNHDPGAASNSECAGCHAPGSSVAPDVNIDVAHEIPAKVAAARIQYNILRINGVAVAQGPSVPDDDTTNVTVTFSITDPTNNNAPYDLQNDDPFTGDATSVNLDVAWPTSDYTNTDGSGSVTGSRVSRPARVTLVNSSGLGGGVTDNGDGTYTVDTGLQIPSGQGLGSGAVSIEGHPAGDWDDPATEANEQDGVFDEDVPVTSAVAYFAIQDSSPQARRTVVDIAKCQDCHGENDGLAFHGGNRTDNIENCVLCHNPNQTDLNRRPAEAPNGSGVVDGSNPNTIDGLEDQTVDMKYMIHAIHGSDVRQPVSQGGTPYVAYGFGDRAHDYSDALIPRASSECLACHVEGSYELPLGSNVLATTTSAGDTWEEGADPNNDPDVLVAADGSATDPGDDGNDSRALAVCSSCHSSSSARDHMLGNGPNGFGNSIEGADQGSINTNLPAGENCAFCHGPNGIVSVSEAHGLE